ncbi:MAG: hypothetical protein HXM95_02655 [Parvimonas micra]|nr:hypothetical protein [Parvimonas micra]
MYRRYIIISTLLLLIQVKYTIKIIVTIIELCEIFKFIVSFDKTAPTELLLLVNKVRPRLTPLHFAQDDALGEFLC